MWEKIGVIVGSVVGILLSSILIGGCTYMTVIYPQNFRAHCTEIGGVVVQVGNSSRSVCLGKNNQILEVAQW